MIPVNVNVHAFGTVAHWRDYRRKVSTYRAKTWFGSMVKFTKQHGKAIAMLSDDSAIILERADNAQGYVKHHVPAERMFWHNGNGGAI